LDSTNNTVIHSRILGRQEITINGIQLLRNSHRSENRLTLKHTNTMKKIQGILLLCKNKAGRNWNKLNTKEISQGSQVLDRELRAQVTSQPRSSSPRGANQNDVININEEEHSDLRTAKHERRISRRRNKAISPKSSTKTSMPSMRCLLEAIESFDHATQMLRM
jgi:hypothetical protein